MHANPATLKEKVTYRAAGNLKVKTLPGYAVVDQSLAEGVRPSKIAWPAAGRPPGLEGVGQAALLKSGRLGSRG